MSPTSRHNPPTHTVPSRPAPTPRPGPADALTTPPADADAQAGQTAPAHRPTWQAVLPDLLAFALGLGLAYVFRWQTADLVWSLWLGSLVIGYLTILATLGSAGLVWLRLLRHPEAAPEDGEEIAVCLVERHRLGDTLQAERQAGNHLDSRLVAYAMGLGLSW